MANCGNSFGRGVYIKSSSINVWSPCPLHETYRTIAERKTYTEPAGGNNSNDLECELCACDCIEDRCLHEWTFKWYRFISFSSQAKNCIHDSEYDPTIDNAVHVSAKESSGREDESLSSGLSCSSAASSHVSPYLTIKKSVTNLISTDACASDVPILSLSTCRAGVRRSSLRV